MAETPILIRSFPTSELTVNEGERAIVGLINTAAVDSYRTVIVPAGVDLTQYEKNPVLISYHNQRQIVGQAMELKRTERAISAKFVTASKPPDHPPEAEWYPNTVLHLYREKVMRGFSIGFEEIEGRDATGRDKEHYGDKCEYVHSKVRVVEVSTCAIPSNPETLASLVSRGFDVELCKRMSGIPLVEAPPITMPPEPQRTIVYFHRPAARTPETSAAPDVERIYLHRARGALYY
jgi:hypothetical protein